MPPSSQSTQTVASRNPGGSDTLADRALAQVFGRETVEFVLNARRVCLQWQRVADGHQVLASMLKNHSNRAAAMVDQMSAAGKKPFQVAKIAHLPSHPSEQRTVSILKKAGVGICPGTRSAHTNEAILVLATREVAPKFLPNALRRFSWVDLMVTQLGCGEGRRAGATGSDRVGALVEQMQDLADLGVRVTPERFHDRTTPLHWLAGFDFTLTPSDRLAMVRGIAPLLKAGADINARDRDGDTPLHWSRDDAMTRALLDAGANAHARNAMGQTPLHVARDPGSVMALLQHGADRNATDWDGLTAWQIFDENNAQDCLQALSQVAFGQIGVVAPVNAGTRPSGGCREKVTARIAVHV